MTRATGDLAYKKIFPSMEAMLKRGHLEVPVLDVPKAGWNLDQLKDHERQPGEATAVSDPAALSSPGSCATSTAVTRIARPFRPFIET
jgi:hypothetical protein